MMLNRRLRSKVYFWRKLFNAKAANDLNSSSSSSSDEEYQPHRTSNTSLVNVAASDKQTPPTDNRTLTDKQTLTGIRRLEPQASHSQASHSSSLMNNEPLQRRVPAEHNGSVSARSPTYLRNATVSPMTRASGTLLTEANPSIEDLTTLDHSKAYTPASRACRPTMLFDPAGSFCYYWSAVVSLAFMYNLWVIIYRNTFDEINRSTVVRWFCMDYACDLVYVLDIVMQFRTGYLDEGVLQTRPAKLRSHYLNSTKFYLDCLSLLPLDFLYLSIGFRSIVRSFRLVKLYKFWAFVEKTERHTNYPNVVRGVLLFHSIMLLFHWNACLIYVFRTNLNYPPRHWDGDEHFYHYLNAYYLSCRTLMLIDSLPKPTKGAKYGFVFVIVEQVFGLIVLATVLGHVAGIVANVSAARKHFQTQLDAVKTYMRLRKVPNHLQRKVIRWFDYWWTSRKYGNDKEVMDCLPDKLKAEIAIHVHLDTLKRVEIFQNTEPGFLCELVLRLKPMLFSPGDYICRRGEVGKEMYIVNRGKLRVLADDGELVLATLNAGSYFGEISILNMGTEGNRRTASVVAVGYSDLFCLTKKEIWEVLADYPAARARLELIANKRLQQKAQRLSDHLSARRSTTTVAGGGGCHPQKVRTPPAKVHRRRGSAPARMAFNVSKHRLSSDSRRPRLSNSAATSSNASTLHEVDDLDERKWEMTKLLVPSAPRKPSPSTTAAAPFKTNATFSGDDEDVRVVNETIKAILTFDAEESTII